MMMLGTSYKMRITSGAMEEVTLWPRGNAVAQRDERYTEKKSYFYSGLLFSFGLNEADDQSHFRKLS